MYSRHLPNRRETDPTIPIAGTVANSGGGYSYEIDKWDRLERFLILGSESGTYYASENKHTLDNIKCVDECIIENPSSVAKMVMDVDDANRAYKKLPMLLVIAKLASVMFDDAQKTMECRRVATMCFHAVVRTGTDLFTFVHYAQSMRGWGRYLKRLIREWYDNRTHDQIVYQMVKYPSRSFRDAREKANVWTHRDLMKLAKWDTRSSSARNAVYQYADKGEITMITPKIAHIKQRMIDMVANNELGDFREFKSLMVSNNVPWEALPTEWQKFPQMWEALLPHMGLTAVLRKLGQMTSCGTFASRICENTRVLLDRLGDDKQLEKARIHPFGVLLAATTYQAGKGVRGSLSWTPNHAILAGLEGAFQLSFKTLPKCNKNVVVAIDASASMTWEGLHGTHITPRMGAACMALTHLWTTAMCYPLAFSYSGFGRNALHGVTPLNITKRSSISETVRAINDVNAGSTNIDAPMLHALDNKLDVDAFVVYTDNENNAGQMHPMEALRKYRREMQKPEAKLIVVGMTATEFSVADDNDKNCMNVVGFDAAAPKLINDFISGTANSRNDDDETE